MYDRDDFKVPNCDTIIEVPVENIVDITNVDEGEQITTDVTSTNRITEIKIHPDLADIDFESIADQTSNALYVNLILQVQVKSQVLLIKACLHYQSFCDHSRNFPCKIY
jgi:hypothetical protein